MYLSTIPGFLLCTSLMCLASLSFLIAMSLMFTAVSLVLIFIATMLYLKKSFFSLVRALCGGGCADGLCGALCGPLCGGVVRVQFCRTVVCFVCIM